MNFDRFSFPYILSYCSCTNSLSATFKSFFTIILTKKNSIAKAVAIQSIINKVNTVTTNVFNAFCVLNLLFIQLMILSTLGLSDAIKYIPKNPQNTEKYTHMRPFKLSGIFE